MNSKTIIFTLMAIILLVSSSFGKMIFTKSDEDFEVSQQTATEFLSMHDNSSQSVNKRESGKDCVKCKLGLISCCAPNQCVRKTLQLDECQEIKTSNHEHGHGHNHV